MKINSTNWNVANTENLYKNFQQKFDIQTDSDNNSLALQDHMSLQSANNQTDLPDSVLSDKEVDVLKLLFGETHKNDGFNFYGNQKPKSVNSGFFLDVKG